MQPIAHIENCYASKFGVPRQSGIVEVESRIVFEPEYRVAEAVRGLEEFDYVWLVWLFSEAQREGWSPTVRPPRLGGNRRMGVFATRSPFRPNAIGLSSVRLVSVKVEPLLGPVLTVSGADLMDGTPLLDIKPYLPYTDSHPQARSGFAPEPATHLLEVHCEEARLSLVEASQRQALIEVLAHDPRPQYHHDPQRRYGMTFGSHEIHFVVDGDQLIVTAIDGV
ncbi:MAG: tRNA (N6-threonylcarbamoyladenosine(37)-N6)-methyltransferase TrmO [Bacteroidales bacterium]|nr:tRNA (N6-threonylcarbamoyladenosine(37)-N6)-methyltransferase TrmO [Bacteroidales bacterium]